MDVPMNHWAYDAIGQLAAKGVLSGYPDGTYKGKQPTTRYEMASALARALALVDLSKASKQDSEMLKKLVVEFKDELDALGVKVDELDVRVSAIESRLGGWRITGVLRQDLTQVTNSNAPWGRSLLSDGVSVIPLPGIGSATQGLETVAFSPLARARLFVERWFGEDESIHFFTRIEGSNGDPYGGGPRGGVQFTRFYAEFPVWWGAEMTVGRQVYDAVEAPYFLDSGANPFSKHMTMGTDSWLYDRVLDGIGLKKTFGMGTLWFYATHSEYEAETGVNPVGTAVTTDKLGFWEVYAAGQLQFSERFGFDAGIQYLLGDDSAAKDFYVPYGWEDHDSTNFLGNAQELSSLYTAFAGLRFNWNENLGLKGMYYMQSVSLEAPAGVPAGVSTDYNDSATAWRAVIDVKQDMLKFTSLWLEYSQVNRGFYMPSGTAALFNNYDWASRELEGAISGKSKVVGYDLNLWRIAAQQQWNERWATFGYFGNATAANVSLDGNNNWQDGTITQYGVGVTYQYNPNVLFGLSWEQVAFSDEWYWGYDDNNNLISLRDPGQIRFRTQVTF
ncbi:MAG: S-layer homology domain-containing protein, partial [Synergistaceae bacterium]|jgi:hypothetical protein|nr:S-layer homology domain-containing protein [Synergistaceae bacterium]